jgi:hypothetical protein
LAPKWGTSEVLTLVLANVRMKDKDNWNAHATVLLLARSTADLGLSRVWSNDGQHLRLRVEKQVVPPCGYLCLLPRCQNTDILSALKLNFYSTVTKPDVKAKILNGTGECRELAGEEESGVKNRRRREPPPLFPPTKHSASSPRSSSSSCSRLSENRPCEPCCSTTSCLTTSFSATKGRCPSWS